MGQRKVADNPKLTGAVIGLGAIAPGEAALPAVAPGPAPLQQITEGDIVPDGDFAGMRYDDVLRALSEDVADVLGDVSIECAGAVLDVAVGEYLATVADAQGPREAKLAAIRFCETALPFATQSVSISETYGARRRIKGAP